MDTTKLLVVLLIEQIRTRNFIPQEVKDVIKQIMDREGQVLYLLSSSWNQHTSHDCILTSLSDKVIYNVNVLCRL